MLAKLGHNVGFTCTALLYQRAFDTVPAVSVPGFAASQTGRRSKAYWLHPRLLPSSGRQPARRGHAAKLLLGQHLKTESESGNATEGVFWKARDLWSAVEWSNLEMQKLKSNESIQSSAATIGGHPPSSSRCAMSVRQHVVVNGCAATQPPRRLS